ncbi:MAG: hypothetical protein LQ341_000435 [Variospora aurantia]|nr:MAG: hypothetical protein LQ341_000435 [Variospora aurantia]
MGIYIWIWTETGREAVAPLLVYYALRLLMFILSFVLEDWAIHDLVRPPRERRVALLLVASSYVTWTYQTHTFSNSIETLVVLWSLVMIQRILDNKTRSSLLSSAVLGTLVAFGTFNRITFPAFLLPSGVFLLPHVSRKPLSLLSLCSAGFITSLLAIVVDTAFYDASADSLSHLLRTRPVITPLNSLFYNTSTSNLSLHGLHPPYHHFVASLPLLLGPALFLLWYIRKLTLAILSALSATLLLSLIPHQEPRFLLPAVPLILSSVRLPHSRGLRRFWLATWILFNLGLGILMGVYHQGGVIRAQSWLGQQNLHDLGVNEVFWWRTYSPSVWLLGGKEVVTTDLMGMKADLMIKRVLDATGKCGDGTSKSVGLVAPFSSIELDGWTGHGHGSEHLLFEQVWKTTKHLNLDDMDFEEDGIRGTLVRVVGRRGLVIWKISRPCGDSKS